MTENGGMIVRIFDILIVSLAGLVTGIVYIVLASAIWNLLHGNRERGRK